MNDQSLSLTELNGRVRNAIQQALPETYWLRAETSDVRRNRNGHCYLEFIEKNAITDSIIAKARGVIWSNVYEMLYQYFEKETGQQFLTGLNVLVRVSIEFHELYGYSLTVVDIDPSFTLGEIARNRQIIINRLEQEGVLTLNKELMLPEITNRIAVISSSTAAGFEDFIHQLNKNRAGFKFYTKLFPAIMQGDRSEASIIAALESIYMHREHFDAITIIRGGGASADLNCFDSYLLANNIAQFPLPVISGIGHERDVTVVDFVAHTRAKTPTAVAEFIIEHMSVTATELIGLKNRVVSESEGIILKEKSELLFASKEVIHGAKMLLQREYTTVDKYYSTIKYQIKQLLQCLYHHLENREQYINMVSPDNILKRGYTLTLKDGAFVTSIDDLMVGDKIETRFKDGSSESEITKLLR
jgi:exodeoxyribonuclease VII large subunit